MNYEIACVDDIVAHFGTISRQRIQQILKKYQDKGRTEVVAKIVAAKTVLKLEKQVKKNGYTVGTRRKCDAIWNFLVRRVGKVAAYMDCTLKFESLLEFRKWTLTQVGFQEDNFELDKDILFKGNRVYSPETCAFVPAEINGLFSGCYRAARRGKYPIGVSFNKGSGHFVAQMSSRQDKGLDKYLGSFKTAEEAFACYKAAKEGKIKKLAEKWRNKIDPRVYDALMSRTVEWED